MKCEIEIGEIHEEREGFLREGFGIYHNGVRSFREIPFDVISDPLVVLSDMFMCIERYDIVVSSIDFPAIAKPVMDELGGFNNGGIWNTPCTFTSKDNNVLVVGAGEVGGIKIRVPWEYR